MKKLTIDFDKCPGPKYCNACGDVYDECNENGFIKYKKDGWAEKQIINNLKAQCLYKAIKLDIL